MLTLGGWAGSPVAISLRLAASSSGPDGAQVCHASTTSTALSKSQARWKLTASGAGTVRKTNEVTTPKPAAPAPRRAQKRSASCCSSHVTTLPSANTSCAESIRSHVSP